MYLDLILGTHVFFGLRQFVPWRGFVRWWVVNNESSCDQFWSITSKGNGKETVRFRVWVWNISLVWSVLLRHIGVNGKGLQVSHRGCEIFPSREQFWSISSEDYGIESARFTSMVCNFTLVWQFWNTNTGESGNESSLFTPWVWNISQVNSVLEGVLYCSIIHTMSVIKFPGVIRPVIEGVLKIFVIKERVGVLGGLNFFILWFFGKSVSLSLSSDDTNKLLWTGLYIYLNGYC